MGLSDLAYVAFTVSAHMPDSNVCLMFVKSYEYEFSLPFPASGRYEIRVIPSEFGLLPKYGIGLTDIVKGQADGDHEIDFGRNGSLLKARLAPYAPRYLCFNGKRAAQEALGVKNVGYGLREETFGPTRLFVATSTSAMAKRWWDAGVWEELARLVRHRQSGIKRLALCRTASRPRSCTGSLAVPPSKYEE